MTTCQALGLALFFVGLWALMATLHLVDAVAEIRRLTKDLPPHTHFHQKVTE